MSNVTCWSMLPSNKLSLLVRGTEVSLGVCKADMSGTWYTIRCCLLYVGLAAWYSHAEVMALVERRAGM